MDTGCNAEFRISGIGVSKFASDRFFFHCHARITKFLKKQIMAKRWGVSNGFHRDAMQATVQWCLISSECKVGPFTYLSLHFLSIWMCGHQGNAAEEMDIDLCSRIVSHTLFLSIFFHRLYFKISRKHCHNFVNLVYSASLFWKGSVRFTWSSAMLKYLKEIVTMQIWYYPLLSQIPFL